MVARVTIAVHLPGKVPAAGAEILGRAKKALEIDKREWLGTTGDNGTFTWPDFETGRQGGFYEFKIIYVDDDGLAWHGSVSEWIAHSIVLTVTLNPGEGVEPLGISKSAAEVLEELETGRSIVESVRQIQTAQNSGLSRAVMTLSAWTLEGLIRFRAQGQKVWRREFDDKNLESLLNTKEIDEMLPQNLKERIRDLVSYSRTHGHMKGAGSVPEDAQIACSTVHDLIEAWYGRRDVAGNRMRLRDNKGVYDPPGPGGRIQRTHL